MAYIKQIWADNTAGGTPITADRLNHMEEGILSASNDIANIDDYVIASGTSGIWYWEKWNSGKAECWGQYSGTVTNYSTGQLGYNYFVDFTYPFEFIEMPSLNAFSGYASGFSYSFTTVSNSSTSMTRVYWSATGASGSNAYISIQVKGRWK